MDDKYTYKEGIVYLNQYHIVFCPKYRRKVLVDDIERDLREIFNEVALEKDVEISFGNNGRSRSYVYLI